MNDRHMLYMQIQQAWEPPQARWDCRAWSELMPEPCGLRARGEHSLEAGGMRDDPEYDALMVLLKTKAAENGYPGNNAYMLGWLAGMYLREVKKHE